jgi:hypothetical protein
MASFGRLIRAGKFRGDPRGVAYIVAIADAAGAIDAIKTNVAKPGDEVEDLGRVSETLIEVFGLSPGQFVRSDKSGVN